MSFSLLSIYSRRGLPGVREKLAMDRQLMKDCLDHYNRLHPVRAFMPIIRASS
jgi:hypothetical protein